VNDAQRLRARAERCLQITRLMRDRDAADQLNAKAAHCLAQAIELELKLAGHSVHSRPSDLHCVGIHAYREGPVPGEEVECAEVAIRRAQAMSTSKWKRMFP
jgi:hypothetical protein